MSRSPEVLHEHDDIHAPRTFDSGDRSPRLTPFLKVARGDGHRWASLDVADLDLATPVLPYAAV